MVVLQAEGSVDQKACIDEVEALECGKVALKAELKGSLYSVAYWAVAMEMISVEYLDAEKDGRRAA